MMDPAMMDKMQQLMALQQGGGGQGTGMPNPILAAIMQLLQGMGGQARPAPAQAKQRGQKPKEKE